MIRFLLLLSISLLLFVPTSIGQTFEWVLQESLSPYGTYGFRSSIAPDNSVYVSGGFIGPSHGEDSTSQGGFLIKYDSDGNQLWEKLIYHPHHDQAISNVTDSQGNVFISGSAPENFLYKYDPSGNLIFHKNIPYASVRGIRVTEGDNILVAGTFWPDSLFENQVLHANAFLAKYDNTGALIWVKEFFYPCSIWGSSCLFTDSHNNIYTTGAFAGLNNAVNDSISISTSGSADAYLAKYDSNGILQWINTITGDYDEVSSTIVTDSLGNIYIGGYYNNQPVNPSYSNNMSSYFDTIIVTKNNLGKDDMFLAKYNASGNCQWVTSIFGNGIDYMRDITLTASDNILITGRCGTLGDSTVFGNQVIYAPGGWSSNFFIASYNTDGNLQWVEASQSGGGQGFGVTSSNAGDVYVTGEFGGPFNVGPFSLTAYWDMFLLKLHENISATVLEESQSNSALFIYPNPTHGQFVIISSELTDGELTIYNSVGEKIHQQIIKSANQQITLNVPSGVYYLKVEGRKQSFVEKIVIH
jgi:hypothetical protein